MQQNKINNIQSVVDIVNNYNEYNKFRVQLYYDINTEQIIVNVLPNFPTGNTKDNIINFDDDEIYFVNTYTAFNKKINGPLTLIRLKQDINTAIFKKMFPQLLE